MRNVHVLGQLSIGGSAVYVANFRWLNSSSEGCSRHVFDLVEVMPKHAMTPPLTNQKCLIPPYI